ncbi:MAG: MFS transporter [Myxococcota bacterium]|nr:MFS transporter [Deltaproteobacteria bacterium]MDQ3335645.1 MFS transporter [Myxococcota bacterium]
MIAGVRQQFATVASFAPRAFWFVWWGTLVNRLGGFVVPLLTIYLIEVRHLSVAEAGGVVSVFGAGNIVASLIGGKLADGIGRRATMLISLFGGAASMFALAFARDPLSIAIMVGVVGLVGELYRPAVHAFVADVVPQAHRVDAFGIMYWAINLGFAVASVIGGLLANIDFTILFIADGITMLVYGVLVAVAVPETKPARIETATAAPARSWLRDRQLVILVVISSVFMLLPMQAGATLSAHMSAQGFTPAAYGIVMAVNGVAIILLQPSMIGRIKRFDAQHVIVAAALLYGAGIAMHGLGTHIAIHMAAVIVWTLGEIIDAPTRSAVVSNLAPPEARGRYQGALVMTFGIAQLFGPKVGTWVWQHEGANVLWSSCLVIGIAVAIAFAITAPGRRRRVGSAI